MEGNRNENLNPVTDLLPNEIWEAVLEKLEDTDDILSFCTIFPQLTGLLTGKGFDWLIAEVLPFIMTRFLNQKDIFCCRLVSKRWKSGIDKCMEQHAGRLPYKSVRLGKITETHFCHSGFFNTATLPKLSTLVNKDIFDPIAGILGSGYKGKNPFFGRCLRIVAKDPNGIGTSNAVRLEDVVPLLERFGNQVWYAVISLQWGSTICEEDFIQGTLGPLFLCLRYLPNLRSLQISTAWAWDNRLHGRVEPCSKERRVELLEITNVHSPVNMERLDLSWLVTRVGGIQNIRYALVAALACKAKIKTLVISIYEWEKDFAGLFPHLTEIYITDFSYGRYQSERTDLPKLRGILREIPTQNILRFGVRGRTLNVPSLLKMLVRSKLLSVQLNMCEKLEYRFDSHIQEFVLVASVKELHLHIPEMENFKFVDLRKILKSFPMLEHLTVTCNLDERDVGLTNDSCLFERSFRNLFFADDVKKESIRFVWEELASLQMLTIHRYSLRGTRGIRLARECGHKLFSLYGQN